MFTETFRYYCICIWSRVLNLNREWSSAQVFETYVYDELCKRWQTATLSLLYGINDLSYTNRNALHLGPAITSSYVL